MRKMYQKTWKNSKNEAFLWKKSSQKRKNKKRFEKVFQNSIFILLPRKKRFDRNMELQLMS